MGTFPATPQARNPADLIHAAPFSRPDEGAPILQIQHLRKQYTTATGPMVLFDHLSLVIRQSEMVAIVGASGSGKSTLLHILGALDTPTAGEVHFAQKPLKFSSPKQAADFRNREVGYVWQFHYLLPEFTAAENVAMPLLARGTSKSQALAVAKDWLGEVELADRAHHRSGELSGGEQQRVALARALVTGPKLLLADEPTGDLDDRSAGLVFSLIERLHRTHSLTSVIVTHNHSLAHRCTRILRLEKGGLTEVSRLETADYPGQANAPVH